MISKTLSRTRGRFGLSQDLKLPPGMQYYHSKADLGRDRVQKLEEMAFQYGRYFDSYLITEPDREYLWASEDSGVLCFSRQGRYLHVAGGVICPDFFRREFLGEIIEFVQMNNFVISFFSLDDEEAELFGEFGFQVSPFGVESRIELDGHSWEGKPYQWVRRQANYVARQAVSFEEWDSASVSSNLWSIRLEELLQISDEHISGKPQSGEIPFFEGRLIPGHLHRRRIFVARNEAGPHRVEGFLICNPMKGGTSWSIEMYRQRADAPRGTIPFLMKNAIDQLKQEGCEEVSICPVPTVGIQRNYPGSSRKVRLALSFWKSFGSLLFDCQGLYHFKSRFRPKFVNTYVCAYPRSGWRSIWAYIKTIKTFDLKWGRILKNLCSLKPQRRTLVKMS